MRRNVEPEALDSLPVDDHSARRARLDLRRIHWFMGTRGILIRAMSEILEKIGSDQPLRILEIGAGDGTLMSRVAKDLPAGRSPISFAMLDRQMLVGAATLDLYEALNWEVTVESLDVLQWAQRTIDNGDADRWDIVLANLFMHHFEAEDLEHILRAIRCCSRAFLACEPKRAAVPLAFSHLVGLIGANAVTRKDAVLSVHAGFNGEELSHAWGKSSGWEVREFSANLFSHCFLAIKAL